MITRRKFLHSLGIGTLTLALKIPTFAQDPEVGFGTFSLVAYDAETEAWGVVVASKILGVGAIVPWARAGIGALAVQARANIPAGPDGLRVLEAGSNAQETLDTILSDDPLATQRQYGIVDVNGLATAYTGAECFPYAGHIIGESFCAQGNILTDETVLETIVEAYTTSEGDFADRLLAGLQAGDVAGGDARGKQSAALYIAKEHIGPFGKTDRYMDLRVDDHVSPVQELIRLRQLHRELFRS